jgi:hypothetical protein
MPRHDGAQREILKWPEVGDPVAFGRAERHLRALNTDVPPRHEPKREQQNRSDQQDLLRVPQPAEQDFGRTKDATHHVTSLCAAFVLSPRPSSPETVFPVA